jgi:hypothetical protein
MPHRLGGDALESSHHMKKLPSPLSIWCSQPPCRTIIPLLGCFPVQRTTSRSKRLAAGMSRICTNREITWQVSTGRQLTLRRHLTTDLY